MVRNVSKLRALVKSTSSRKLSGDTKTETTLSKEAQEYIETIYRLQKRDGMAKTKELAKALHVVPGSITNTIEHLERHNLVTHKPYRGVKLTPQGEKLALDLLRRHRLAERLLTDVLKADWSDVHEDACKLEHALTDNVVALLEKRLGYPTCCPHGNPIPEQNGSFTEERCFSLNEAELEEPLLVVRITDENRGDLATLSEAGIKPKTLLQVTQKTANHVFLQVGKKTCQLPLVLAGNVHVRRVGEKNHV